MALPFNYKFVKSPNYTRGRRAKISKIIIHWMVGTLASTDAVFKNRRSGVSAHYGVENKNVHQYVREKNTAWHAISANPFSIGIEHSAAPGRAPSAQTYETSAQLIARICKEYGLNPDKAIEPHCKYVQTRCPGTDKNGKVREKGGVDIKRLKKRVKEILNPPKPKSTPKKKAEDKITKAAKAVLAGKYGNGPTRVKNLKKAGLDPKKVQAKVNAMLRRK